MFDMKEFSFWLTTFLVSLSLPTGQAIEAEIFWAPSLNVTVPLGVAQAVFECGGQGNFLLWWINDDLVVSHEEPIYERRGFTFTKINHSNGSIVNTLTISATVENNNTQLRCHATGDGGAVTSETVTLTVAGPPLTPRPIFHVVNATHIEVQWDKPFSIPDIDVRSYTLSVWNTSSTSYVFSNETFPIFEDTEYPIRYYVSNEGNIPNVCVYLNFTLSASNDAGTSRLGHTTGGFAIDIPLIDINLLESMIISSEGNVLTLVINFTSPNFCSYQQAMYNIIVYNEERQPIATLEPVEFPEESDVVVYLNVFLMSLASEKSYEVEITVKSVLSTNSIRKTFVNSHFNGTSSSEDKAIRCTMGLISIALTMFIAAI